MAASRQEVFERVKEVLVEQLGVDEDADHRRGFVPGRPRRRLARPRGADHGARGSVRDQDLRRGRAEDHDRGAGRRLRLDAPVRPRPPRKGWGAATPTKADRCASGAIGWSTCSPTPPGRGTVRLRTSGSSSSATASSSSRSRARCTSATRTSRRGGWRRSARTSSRARAVPRSRSELELGPMLAERGAALPDEELAAAGQEPQRAGGPARGGACGHLPRVGLPEGRRADRRRLLGA